VNKEEFNSIVQNYTCLEKDEVEALFSLLKENPYSQVIHNLVAKAANDLQLSDKDHYLIQSAIYSTDRAVLKSVIIALKTERINTSVKEESKSPEYEPPFIMHAGKTPVANEPVSYASSKESSLNSEQLYQQVDDDLAELKHSKDHYEKVMALLEKNKFMPISVAKSASETLNQKPTDDGLIEEIKNSKHKLIPEGPRQKEQIDIIDRFIKTQPSISKPTAVSSKGEDLTEKIDVFGENIVSETLVEILLKQGKKEKAIEMLKKLIWKFPQKKTYFAAQIEELKN
jgi:tetratricopeptide (TPR) repeat protein